MALLSYLRYSNFKISFDLNPFVWSFRYWYQGPAYIDPHLHMWYIRVLFISCTLIVDDGSYRLPEPDIIGDEEEINTHRDKGGPYD